MDYIVMSLDVSSLAVGLFALGFVLGMAVSKPVYFPLSLISSFFGINATRYIFGAGYDFTVTVSYFAVFFTVGAAIGNYIEHRHRETKTMLNMIRIQLNSLSNYLLTSEKNKKNCTESA